VEPETSQHKKSNQVEFGKIQEEEMDLDLFRSNSQTGETRNQAKQIAS
jgi:hypothetical protein